jgi:hypothetical protein
MNPEHLHILFGAVEPPLGENSCWTPDVLINGINAVATLMLAALAIWQDRIIDLIRPARGDIEEANFSGKEEGTTAARKYCYHIKAVSRKRWRPLRGAIIRFREIDRTIDSGKRQEARYPVWRQLPWAPAERCEALQTITDEQECDLGAYDALQDCFEIASYQQGGEFDPCIGRGQIGHVRLHLRAENLRRDTVVEITVDMSGAQHTKPKVELRKIS